MIALILLLVLFLKFVQLHFCCCFSNINSGKETASKTKLEDEEGMQSETNRGERQRKQGEGGEGRDGGRRRRVRRGEEGGKVVVAVVVRTRVAGQSVCARVEARLGDIVFLSQCERV